MAEKIGEAIYLWLLHRKHRLALVIVWLPMLVLLAYYTIVATDRYVAESRVVVRNSGGAVQLGGFSLPFLGPVGGASWEDALHLREFIHSQDLLDRLNQKFDLHAEFKMRGWDFVSMLPPWAKKEDVLKLYRKRVEVGFDDKTGVLIIATQASAPELAQKLNQAILDEAETFINEVSRRIAREQVEFASGELQRSRKALDDARDRLLSFQNANAVLDPAATAEASQRIIAELEGQLAAKQVELNTVSGVMQSDAAQPAALRQTIEGLKKQIESEKRKLTSRQGAGLNRIAAQFLDHRAMVEFQADVYKVSLATLEKTRIEAARKVKNLAVLASPQLPEEAKYPRRAYMLGAWFFALFMLFGVVRLTLEIIEDHRD